MRPAASAAFPLASLVGAARLVGGGDRAPGGGPFVAVERGDVGQRRAHVGGFQSGERIGVAVGARLGLGLELLDGARRRDLGERGGLAEKKHGGSAGEKGATAIAEHGNLLSGKVCRVIRSPRVDSSRASVTGPSVCYRK